MVFLGSGLLYLAMMFVAIAVAAGLVASNAVVGCRGSAHPDGEFSRPIAVLTEEICWTLAGPFAVG